MRARIDRSPALVGHRAAVEDRVPVLVDRLELDPDVERIDRAARKEVPDLPRAHDDVDPHRIAARVPTPSTLSSGAITSAAAPRKFCAAPKFSDSSPTAKVLAARGSAAVGARPAAAGAACGVRTSPKMSTEIGPSRRKSWAAFKLGGILVDEGERPCSRRQSGATGLYRSSRQGRASRPAACGSRRTSDGFFG